MQATVYVEAANRKRPAKYTMAVRKITRSWCYPSVGPKRKSLRDRDFLTSLAGVEGIEPSQAGFGDRRSTGELHACVGTNWRTRTALTRSTAVCHHPIGLVGIGLVARPRAARGARPL
jgi:hypothetical protein